MAATGEISAQGQHTTLCSSIRHCRLEYHVTHRMFLRSALLSFGTSGLAATPFSTALAADAGPAGRVASDVACAELPILAREVPGDAADSRALPLAHCPCKVQKVHAVIQDSSCMGGLLQVRLSSRRAD